MPEYLVGIMYHEKESFALWKRGVIEDYESSTGLYIDADNPDHALAWGAQVGSALLKHADPGTTADWNALYYCWLVESPATSNWAHRLDKFQHVRVGQMPNLQQMMG
jgi:hypothetical protein